MTENEAISELKMIKHTRVFLPSDEVWEMAIQALEDIQAYRAIGTVEECKQRKEYFDIINEVLKDYSDIGTIEEFKALKEKNEPRELFGNEWNPVHTGDTVNGLCPVCMESFVCITPRMYKANNYGYCRACGQKLDWSE